jgi:hypothetical protein
VKDAYTFVITITMSFAEPLLSSVYQVHPDKRPAHDENGIGLILDLLARVILTGNNDLPITTWMTCCPKVGFASFHSVRITPNGRCYLG